MADGDWTYRGTPNSQQHTLVPAEELLRHPRAAEAADEQGRLLDFDFRDDTAVLEMLRLRRKELDKRFLRGLWTVFPATLLCIPAIAQATNLKDANDPRMSMILLGANVLLILLFLFPYIWHVWRVYMSQERKNMRARCNGYRRIVKAARQNGVPVPDHYPHVVEMRINATYKRIPEKTEKVGKAGEAAKAER